VAGAYGRGHRLIAPLAGHLAGRIIVVTLRPGHSAHAILQIASAAAACHDPVRSALLGIRPPGQPKNHWIRLIMAVCPHQRTLAVGPVRPGIGVP